MLIFLLETFILIIKIIFKVLFFLIKLTAKVFKIILTTNFLRFPFLLFILGYLLHIEFKILTTIYFVYLTHLAALKFNIYNKIYNNLKATLNKIYTSYKLSMALSPLKSNSIILNNIFLEDDDNEGLCVIDGLIITKSCVFIIKALNDFKTSKKDNKAFKNSYFKKINKDEIIDIETINNVNNEISYCYSVLQNILPEEIPIKNVITLPNNNLVVVENSLNTTPIISINDLQFFIEKNIDNKINYPLTYIKDNILENKLWSLDIFLFKLENFLINNKVILLFLVISILLYYLYNTSLSYIVLNLIN